MKVKVKATLGRRKMLKSGGCPAGSVLKRGGKSRRKSCVLGARRRRSRR